MASERWNCHCSPNRWKLIRRLLSASDLSTSQLEGGPANRAVKAVVNIVENLGGETYLHVELAPELPLIMVKLHGSRGPNRGNRVMLHFPADKIYLFDATGAAIPVRVLN